MGKINLLIATATHQFSGEDELIIHEATQDAEAFINDTFIFDYEVDIVVTAPSFLLKTIPEDGIITKRYLIPEMIYCRDGQGIGWGIILYGSIWSGRGEGLRS